jgi:hypothetical protein
MRALGEPIDCVARVDWARLVLLCARLGSPGSEVSQATGIPITLIVEATARSGQRDERIVKALDYDQVERLTAWLGVLERYGRAREGEPVADWRQAVMCAVACGVPRDVLGSRIEVVAHG